MTTKRMPAPPGIADGQAEESGGHSARLGSVKVQTQRGRHRALNAADGTRQLLISGAWTMIVGLLAGALAATVFGGIGPQGAHSNAGWLALMVAMMSVPFAILLLLLGGAKWLRNLGLSRLPS